MFKLLVFKLSVFKLTVLTLLLVAMNGYAGQGMDPTRPLTGGITPDVKPTNTRLTLQSIISSGTERRVIISGKTLKLGDEISGLKIIAIQPTTVVLTSADSRIELSLFSGAVKKPQ